MIPASVYADAARLKKIIFLSGAIDSALTMMGVDPFSARALEFVLSMTPAAWKCAASQAGVNPPSATTIAAIEDLYRRRIEVRACLIEAFRIESESNVSIAALYPRHGGAEVADACLMAAAPDLVEALLSDRRTLLAIAQGTESHAMLDVVNQAIGRNYAALKKAGVL